MFLLKLYFILLMNRLQCQGSKNMWCVWGRHRCGHCIVFPVVTLWFRAIPMLVGHTDRNKTSFKTVKLLQNKENGFLQSDFPFRELWSPKLQLSKTQHNLLFHFECEVTYAQVWWPILWISALQLTHPKCTHKHSSEHTHRHTHTHTEHTPGAVGSHLCCAWEAVGGSVPCSKGISVMVLMVERVLYIVLHLQPVVYSTYNYCQPKTRTLKLWITSPTL